MPIKLLAAFCGGFLFLNAELNAQLIRGQIVDHSSGVAIENALIYLHELNKSSLSDDNGFFEFNSIKEGVYHLHVSCLGYQAQSVDVRPDSAPILVKMTPTSLEISEVLVEDSYLKSELRNRSLNVEQLSKSDLLNNAATNLSESLANLPGLRALSVGSGIAKPVIRGLSGNRILVNQQGVKQEGQQWGSDHGLEIDPFSIDRVEIIKGPSSLLYGSDGLGGVINILPAPIPEPHSWSAEVLVNARENDQSIGTSIKSDVRGDDFFAEFRISYRDYGDLRVPEESFTYLSRVLPIEDGVMKNTAGRDLSYSASLGMLKDWGYVRLTASTFRQKAGLFPGIFGIPTTQSLASDGDQRNVDFPRQEVIHNKLILNLNRNMRNGWIEADFGVQHNDRQELSLPHSHGNEPVPDSKQALQLSLNSFSSNIRRHWNQIGSWKTVLGISAAYNTNQSSGWEFLVPDYRNYQTGVFLTAERKFRENLVWNWGARVDYGHVVTSRFLEDVYNAQLEVTGQMVRTPGSDKGFWNVSGGTGLAYDLSPMSHLKANIGKSYRIPNAAELASNGVHHGTFRHEMGYVGLKPEHGYQLDLSYRLTSERVLVNLSPYFNYYDGFIYLRPSGQFSFLPEAGQIYEYVQSNAIFTGAELFVDFHPLEHLHLELGSDVVYSYNLETSLNLPFTPPIRNRWTIKWENDQGDGLTWNTGITWTQVFSQEWVDRNEETTPGYHTFDAFVALKHRNYSIQLRLNNAFNESYLDHLSRYRLINLPAQGRNFMISVYMPLSGKLKSRNNQEK